MMNFFVARPSKPKDPTAEKKHRFWQKSLIFLLASFIICFVRQHTFDEPLEADEAIYSVIAQDWLSGGMPYQTLWDNKPIGIFMIYRIAISLGTYHEIVPKIAATISVLITTLLLVNILFRFSLHFVSCINLTVCWAFYSSLTTCYANGANAEVFLLPLLTGALLLTDHIGKRKRYFVLTYVLLGCALAIKHVVLPYFLVPLLFLPSTKRKYPYILRLIRPSKFDGISMPDCKAPFRKIDCLQSTFLLHLVGVCILTAGIQSGIYYHLGYDPLLPYQQFWQGKEHVSGDVHHSLIGFLKNIILIPFNEAIRPIWLLVILSFFAAVITSVKSSCREARFGRILLGFLIASCIAIAIPGSNFPHYYILILPFPIVGLGMISEKISVKWQPYLPGILALYLIVHTYSSCIAKHPNEISFAKYKTNWFIRDRFIGNMLFQRGLTGKSMYVDGSHPSIFFYAKNQPATKYFLAWNYASMKVTSWEEVFSQLRRNPPEVCVLLNPSNPTFQEWLKKNYSPLDSIAGSLVFRLREVGLRKAD